MAVKKDTGGKQKGKTSSPKIEFSERTAAHDPKSTPTKNTGPRIDGGKKNDQTDEKGS